MPISRHQLLSSTALALALATAGCGDPPKAAGPAPAVKKAEAKAAEDKAAEGKEKEVVLEYSYSPVGKRDPFRSILDELAAKAEETPTTGRDCGPLCKWELDQLKLVAVISGLSNPLGMVEDPRGKGYVIRRGTFLGKHNGKVTQIRTGEIVITEIFKDQMGKPHANPRVIKLPADKKESTEDDQNLLGAETE